jgi:hypothetical protein
MVILEARVPADELTVTVTSEVVPAVVGAFHHSMLKGPEVPLPSSWDNRVPALVDQVNVGPGAVVTALITTISPGLTSVDVADRLLTNAAPPPPPWFGGTGEPAGPPEEPPPQEIR